MRYFSKIVASIQDLRTHGIRVRIPIPGTADASVAAIPNDYSTFVSVKKLRRATTGENIVEERRPLVPRQQTRQGQTYIGIDMCIKDNLLQ